LRLAQLAQLMAFSDAVGVCRADYTRLRKLVIELVLATDMRCLCPCLCNTAVPEDPGHLASHLAPLQQQLCYCPTIAGSTSQCSTSSQPPSELPSSQALAPLRPAPLMGMTGGLGGAGPPNPLGPALSSHPAPQHATPWHQQRQAGRTRLLPCSGSARQAEGGGARGQHLQLPAAAWRVRRWMRMSGCWPCR
jgi:hypothetical protein